MVLFSHWECPIYLDVLRIRPLPSCTGDLILGTVSNSHQNIHMLFTFRKLSCCKSLYTVCYSVLTMLSGAIPESHLQISVCLSPEMGISWAPVEFNLLNPITGTYFLCVRQYVWWKRFPLKVKWTFKGGDEIALVKLHTVGIQLHIRSWLVPASFSMNSEFQHTWVLFSSILWNVYQFFALSILI